MLRKKQTKIANIIIIWLGMVYHPFFVFWGLMKTPLLSSAGFVCLRVGYREVFWEEFCRLT